MNRSGISLIIICLILSIYSKGIYAQAATPESKELEIISVTTIANAIVIEYSIPFEGILEFDIFTVDDKRIIHNTFFKERGTYKKTLRRDVFKPGEVYKFKFLYKGKEKESTFST